MYLATWRERVSGVVLMCALVPMALLGYLTLLWVGVLGQTVRGRAGVRALDHFVNATVFNGYAWESLSSHAWRARDRQWAKALIWLTDRVQKDHCLRANKREQPLVDLIVKKGLHHPTIL